MSSFRTSNTTEDSTMLLPPNLSSRLPSNFTVVDSFNQKFANSIRHLRRQDVIAVFLGGQDIGRHCTLEWLCVSTSAETFFYDARRLQKKLFSEGLKQIFENSKIIKVFHDCRQTSDCLFHQFGVDLSNVYDTQVTDFIINAQVQKVEDLSNKVNTLDYCLERYLHIPKEFLHQAFQDCYTIRPLNEAVRNVLVKNVIYLRALRQEQEIMVRTPFRRCCDVFLNSLLKKSDQEMELYPPNMDTIPEELLLENMMVVKIDHSLKPKFPKKFETESEADPRYRYERDCYLNQREMNRISAGYMRNLYDDFNFGSGRYSDRKEIVEFLMDRMYAGSDNSFCLNVDNTDNVSVVSPCASDLDASNLRSVSAVEENTNRKNSLLKDVTELPESSPFYRLCKANSLAFHNQNITSLALRNQERLSNENLQPFENLTDSDSFSASSKNTNIFSKVRVKEGSEKDETSQIDPSAHLETQNVHGGSEKSSLSNSARMHVVLAQLKMASINREHSNSQSTSASGVCQDLSDSIPSDNSNLQPEIQSGKSLTDSQSSVIQECKKVKSSADSSGSECSTTLSVDEILMARRKRALKLKGSNREKVFETKCVSESSVCSLVEEKSKLEECDSSQNSASSYYSHKQKVDSSIKKSNLNDSTSSDDDPWASLRNAFDELGPINYGSKKPRFIPAGMQY